MATPTQVKLVNAGSPLEDDGQYYVGPYTLQINGDNMPVLCVDFQDESWVGDIWSANISQVGGDISLTYHPADTVQYEEEAYLYHLITQPNADRVDIQHAAWAITDPNYNPNAAAQTYINLAVANYSQMNFNGYEIISSANNPHEQEFMTMTPEPASLALFGGGLLAFGSFFRRRRRPQQATVPVSE